MRAKDALRSEALKETKGEKVMSEQKCGCLYAGSGEIDNDDCLYPEAVAAHEKRSADLAEAISHLKAMIFASSWANSKTVLAAEAFLERVGK